MILQKAKEALIDKIDSIEDWDAFVQLVRNVTPQKLKNLIQNRLLELNSNSDLTIDSINQQKADNNQTIEDVNNI